MRITYPDAHNLSASARPARLEAAAWPAEPGRTTSRRAERSSRRGWRPASGRGVQVSEIRQALWQPEIWGATPNLAASPRKAERKKSPGPNGPGDYRSGWRDLNPRPLRPERSALPSCATARLATDVDITLWWWTMQIGMSRVLRDGGFAVCTGLSSLVQSRFCVM